jgi:very-short-patch-repair endonuclease
MGATPFDRAIRVIAGRQYGAFSADQALSVDGTRAALRQRRRREEIFVRGDGVYVVSGAPDCWRQKLWIALLEVGNGAVVDGRAAYALWRVPGFAEGPIEVLALHGRKNHRLTVGVLHETRLLPSSHVRSVDGIPVTSPERTLFTAAARENYRCAERATDNMLTMGLTSPERLWRAWGDLAARGRPGTVPLRAILLERQPGYVAPATELEARFRDLLRDEGIEQPERQVDLGGDGWIGRVDCYFRRRLIVELDGRIGHVSELDQKRDKERDAELTAAGFVVIHFTWEQIVTRPAWVVRMLRGALASAAA